MNEDEVELYNWWNITKYCYICGFGGHVPWLGYYIIRWHSNRVLRDD